MFKCIYITYLFSLLLLCCPFNVACGESCSTSSCHPGMLQQKNTHQPVAEGECESCHQLEKSEHPGDEGPDFALVATEAMLCFECHEEASGSYEHGPAVSGACFVCHDPHGSEQESLLRAPLRELCLGCHADVAAGLQGANFVHSAIEKLDCGACHQPHTSEFPKLLNGETSMICFDCHEDIKEKYDRALNKHAPLYSGSQCTNCHQAHYSEYSALLLWDGNDSCMHCHGSGKNGANFKKRLDKELIHAPIEDEGCVACHDPHGSRYSFILKGAYPQAVYAPYEKESYGLCFQCHEEELLEAGSDYTAFRNGKVNLHKTHVGRKVKGRTCKVCHDVHASDGQSMVSSAGIPFGDWKIPVRFEPTDTGGGCMPGCHRAMNYDTLNPVDNSHLDADNVLEIQELEIKNKK